MPKSFVFPPIHKIYCRDKFYGRIFADMILFSESVYEKNKREGECA